MAADPASGFGSVRGLYWTLAGSFALLLALLLWSMFQGPGYADESYFWHLANGGGTMPGTMSACYYAWHGPWSLDGLRFFNLLLLTLGNLALAAGCWKFLRCRCASAPVPFWVLFSVLCVGHWMGNWSTPPFADYATLNLVAASCVLGALLWSRSDDSCHWLAGLLCGASAVQFVFFYPPGLAALLPMVFLIGGRNFGRRLLILFLGAVLGAGLYFLLLQSPTEYWRQLLVDLDYYRHPLASDNHQPVEMLRKLYTSIAGELAMVAVPAIAWSYWSTDLRRDGKWKVSGGVLAAVMIFLLLRVTVHNLKWSWNGGFPVELWAMFALAVALTWWREHPVPSPGTAAFLLLLTLPFLLCFGSDMRINARIRSYYGLAVLAAFIAAWIGGSRRALRGFVLLLLVGTALSGVHLWSTLWSRGEWAPGASFMDETARLPETRLRIRPEELQVLEKVRSLACGRRYLVGGKFGWWLRVLTRTPDVSRHCFTALEALPELLERAHARPDEVLIVDRRIPLLPPEVEADFRTRLGVGKFHYHRLAGSWHAITLE